jgi:hypothetical protein
MLNEGNKRVYPSLSWGFSAFAWKPKITPNTSKMGLKRQFWSNKKVKKFTFLSPITDKP